jgi:hypothetical protein
MNPIPTEQTTAATDLIITVVALGCALSLWRLRPIDVWKVTLWSAIYGLLSLAGLLGALAHGLALPEIIKFIIWQPLNLTLGVMVALFVTGAVYDWRGVIPARRTLRGMLGAALLFYLVTLIFSDTFLVFVIYALLAMLAAIFIYTRLALSGHLPGAWLMVGGIVIFMAASIVQGGKLLAFTFIWQFDHNGAFHLIQLAGYIYPAGRAAARAALQRKFAN